CHRRARTGARHRPCAQGRHDGYGTDEGAGELTATRLAPPSSRSDTLPQARRVRRVIRKIDVWSVLRFSVIFYACVFAVLILAGLALFIVASVTGVRHDIEKSIGSYLASTNFHILGGDALRAAILGGVVLIISGTGANALMALLYNLTSDALGGAQG